MRHTNTANGCGRMCQGDQTVLIGCGILAREIHALIKKNDWSIATVLFDSNLHNDFVLLGEALTSGLNTHPPGQTIVFYGCCHPLIDDMVAGASSTRTQGQNCVEMLLGHTLFTSELEQGAYFLFESWARNWPRVIAASFGTTRPEVIRAIFAEDRRYLLALRTPCSGDFTREAEEAGRSAGLPVRWQDVSLDHLELTLRNAIGRHLHGVPA